MNRWTDITPEDILRIKQETEMNYGEGNEGPLEGDDEWDGHGFSDAQDFWRWKEK